MNQAIKPAVIAVATMVALVAGAYGYSISASQIAETLSAVLTAGAALYQVYQVVHAKRRELTAAALPYPASHDTVSRAMKAGMTPNLATPTDAAPTLRLSVTAAPDDSAFHQE